MTPKSRDARKQYYKKLFEKFDNNHSGTIDIRELKCMLENDEEAPKKLVRAVFKRSDRNQDGEIDFEEFYHMAVHDKKLKQLFSHYIDIYMKHIFPRHTNTCEMVTDGAYEESYSCWPPPVIMVAITVIELVLFCVDKSFTSNYANGMAGTYLIYDPDNRHQIWRYLTYMFVHVGYEHLVANLLIQVMLAIPLEMVHKWRVIVLYVAGVLAGSLLNALGDPSVTLAGASGGVYSLMTAYFGTIIMNWNDMIFPFQYILLFIFLIITGMDVGYSLYNRFWVKTFQKIGYLAHFGGALSGFLMGIWVLKNFSYMNREKYIWWTSFTMYILLMIVMIALNIFWTDRFQ